MSGRWEVKRSSGGSGSKTAAGGTGFLTLLQIAFIVLKLCKVIDWSWWWVLAPTWIPTALVILVVLIVIIAHAIHK